MNMQTEGGVSAVNRALTVLLAFGNAPEAALLHGRSLGLAYVCRQGACRLPLDEPGSLSAEIALAVAGSTRCKRVAMRCRICF